MTTTELITPPRDPRPTFAEELDETVPLIGLIPVAGPPLVFLAGPWLLFGLMLAGPFAVLVTLVALLVAAWALVALIGEILAAPYRLVRHLRSHRAPHASPRVAAPQLVPAEAR